MSRGNPRVTIRLEAEIIRQLQEKAAEQGKNLSALLREIILTFLQ